MTERHLFHKHRGAQTGLSASHKEQHGLCCCMFLSSVLCIQVVLLQFENFHKGSCVFAARRGSSSGRCKCAPLIHWSYFRGLCPLREVCVCVSVIDLSFFRLLFYFNTAKTKHNFITFTYSHNVLLIVYNNNIKITVHLQICQNRHCRPYDFSERC